MVRAAASIAILTAVVALGATEASAQSRTRAGVLTCNVAGGIGLILGSQKATVCIFDPRRGRNERYTGVIRKFGLDIGATQRACHQMGGVLRRQSCARLACRHLCGGKRRGDRRRWARRECARSAGNNRTVALQPLSVSGQTGLNFALGVGDLELRVGH